MFCKDLNKKLILKEDETKKNNNNNKLNSGISLNCLILKRNCAY